MKLSSSLQTLLALSLVVLTALLFIVSWWRKRNKQGCGGGCGCASQSKLILKKKPK